MMIKGSENLASKDFVQFVFEIFITNLFNLNLLLTTMTCHLCIVIHRWKNKGKGKISV